MPLVERWQALVADPSGNDFGKLDSTEEKNRLQMKDAMKRFAVLFPEFKRQVAGAGYRKQNLLD